MFGRQVSSMYALYTKLPKQQSKRILFFVSIKEDTTKNKTFDSLCRTDEFAISHIRSPAMISVIPSLPSHPFQYHGRSVTRPQALLPDNTFKQSIQPLSQSFMTKVHQRHLSYTACLPKIDVLLPKMYPTTPICQLIALALICSFVVYMKRHETITDTDSEFSYLFNQLFHLLHQGETQDSFVKLVEIAKIYPQLTEALLMIEAGHFEEGLDLLEFAVSTQFQSDEPIYILKGLIYLASKSYDAAKQCFEHVINTTKNPYLKAIALLHQAEVLNKQDQPDKAHNFIQQAHALNCDTEQIRCDYERLHQILDTYCSEYQLLARAQAANYEIDVSNRVVVRVWEPSHKLIYNTSAKKPISDNQGNLGKNEVEVGHASLQAKSYISFWPPGHSNDADLIYDDSQQPIGSLHTLFDDILVERRLPDERVVLYNLNAMTIEKTFLDFKSKRVAWNIFASSRFLKNDGIANCSGIVADLLYAGGIEQLITFNDIKISQKALEFIFYGILGFDIEKYMGNYALLLIRAIPNSIEFFTRENAEYGLVDIILVYKWAISNIRLSYPSYFTLVDVLINTAIDFIIMQTLIGEPPSWKPILAKLLSILLFGEGDFNILFWSGIIGAISGGIFDITEGTHLVITPKGISWLARSALQTEQRLIEEKIYSAKTQQKYTLFAYKETESTELQFRTFFPPATF